MELTKIERYTLYCCMLHELENYKDELRHLSDGFCYMLYMGYGFDKIYSNYEKCLLPLPELKDKKPSVVSDFGLWFKSALSQNYGRSKRIEILNQCIIETHPDKI